MSVNTKNGLPLPRSSRNQSGSNSIDIDVMKNKYPYGIIPKDKFIAAQRNSMNNSIAEDPSYRGSNMREYGSYGEPHSIRVKKNKPIDYLAELRNKREG